MPTPPTDDPLTNLERTVTTVLDKAAATRSGKVEATPAAATRKAADQMAARSENYVRVDSQTAAQLSRLVQPVQAAALIVSDSWPTRDQVTAVLDQLGPVTDPDRRAEVAQEAIRALLNNGAQDIAAGLSASGTVDPGQIQERLREIAADEAREAQDASATTLNPTKVPPISVEASAPHLLPGRIRKIVAYWLLVLAVLCVIAAPATLALIDDDSDGSVALTLGFVAMLSVIAALAVTMGYGSLKIRTGLSEEGAPDQV